jgi:Ca2+-binding EF-hand superfamily protein
MKSNWIALTAVSLLLVTSPAFADNHGDKRGHKMEEVMDKIDKNGDGIVTEQEFIEVHKEQFDTLDENGDGEVTEDELKSAHKRMKEKRHDKMFEKMDADGDGVISREEMAAHQERMKEKAKEKMKDRRQNKKGSDQ